MLARESAASEPQVASVRMSNLRYTYCFRTRQNQDAARPSRFPVEEANHEQLARWYRFLSFDDTKEQRKDRIAERFKKLGGMTPALEKKIGF